MLTLDTVQNEVTGTIMKDATSLLYVPTVNNITRCDIPPVLVEDKLAVDVKRCVDLFWIPFVLTLRTVWHETFYNSTRSNYEIERMIVLAIDLRRKQSRRAKTESKVGEILGLSLFGGGFDASL